MPKVIEATPYEAVVFFVDLVGSSSVSSELPVKRFWRDYVRPFYGAIDIACAYCKRSKFQFLTGQLERDYTVGRGMRGCLTYRGDELVGMLLFTEQAAMRGIPVAASEVVRFVYALKLFWLGTRYNLRRMKDGRRPRGLAAGINVGQVGLVERSKQRRYKIGYTINLAKRVESASREGGSSHVYATGEVQDAFEQWRTDKGIPEEEKLLVKAVCFGELQGGEPAAFRGIDPPPDICELEIDDEEATRVITRLQGSHGYEHSHLEDRIGRYLFRPPRSPWVKEGLTLSDLNGVSKRLSAYASKWFLADAALLLTGADHPDKKKALALLQDRLSSASATRPSGSARPGRRIHGESATRRQAHRDRRQMVGRKLLPRSRKPGAQG